MKKAIFAGLFSVLFLVSVAAAVKPAGPSAYHGLTHPGKASQLYLYEKDPVTWEIVEDGAWGKMTFDGDSFVFNGHGLDANVEYTLIRYTDSWPGYPVVCLANGETNKGGNIHMSGVMLEGGPKIWLVLSSDVDCNTQKMTGWNPSKYLFEYNVI